MIILSFKILTKKQDFKLGHFFYFFPHHCSSSSTLAGVTSQNPFLLSSLQVWWIKRIKVPLCFTFPTFLAFCFHLLLVLLPLDLKLFMCKLNLRSSHGIFYSGTLMLLKSSNNIVTGQCYAGYCSNFNVLALRNYPIGTKFDGLFFEIFT